MAGVAGLVAGALSMAAGEYVSVSTQRDSERALLEKERRELVDEPAGGARRAGGHLRRQGPQRGPRPRGRRGAHRPRRAGRARRGRAGHRPRRPHEPVDGRLGVDGVLHRRCAAAAADDRADARRAAGSSVTVVAVVVALALTGWASARLGYGAPRKAVLRNVAGGLLAMAVTYGIGTARGVGRLAHADVRGPGAAGRRPSRTSTRSSPYAGTRRPSAGPCPSSCT